MDLWENSDLSEDYSSYYSMMKKEKKAMICDAIGCCYCKLGNAFEAMEYYKNAIKLECQYLDVTMQDVQNGKVNEELLGVYLYDYSFCYYMQKKESDGDDVMKLAALCGNQDAIDFCRKYNVNYQVKSSRLFE